MCVNLERDGLLPATHSQIPSTHIGVDDVCYEMGVVSYWSILIQTAQSSYAVSLYTQPEVVFVLIINVMIL